MNRYHRKKPVEAMQYDGSNGTAITSWTRGGVFEAFPGRGMLVPTPEGDVIASVSDWIVRDDVQGRFFRFSSEIFAVTYEPVTERKVTCDV